MKKTVFITGGSRGIGAACVKKFSKEGWNVAFTYNENKEAADRLVSELLNLEKDASSILSLKLSLPEPDDSIGRIMKEARTYCH